MLRKNNFKRFCILEVNMFLKLSRLNFHFLHKSNKPFKKIIWYNFLTAEPVPGRV